MKKYLFLSLLLCGLFISAEAQWVEQATGFATANRGIRFVSAVDTNVLWAIAYDGGGGTAEIQEFTRTTNGGTLWVANTIPGYTSDGLSMICAVDSMNAWIPVWYAAGGGTILHTSDGGQNWTAQTTATFAAPSGFPNVVHFWDVNNGFCMGDPNGGYFEIYTTTDGGTTWNRVAQADIPANNSGEYGTTGLYDVVGNTVWFTTGKGRVYKSVDMGYHWTVAATPNTTQQLIIDFQDANVGIVKANLSPYNAYKSIDGGTTWQLLTSTGNFYQNDFCYIPGTPATYVSVGADATTPFMGISYSTDTCKTWTDYPGTNTSQFLTADFVDMKHGWAGAFNADAVTGGMWKYYGTDFVVGLDNNTDAAKLGIWPNPANDNLNISADSRIDHVEIFDGLGQMVLSQKILETKTVLSTNQLNPGIYFIKVYTETGNTSGRFLISR
jgi:hypothetical protein